MLANHEGKEIKEFEEKQRNNEIDFQLKDEMYNKKFERFQRDISTIKESLLHMETNNDNFSPAEYDRTETVDINKSFNEARNMISHK